MQFYYLALAIPQPLATTGDSFVNTSKSCTSGGSSGAVKLLRGRDGRDGLTGRDGMPGPPGAPGKHGLKGLKGDKGDKGERGETGAAGVPGGGVVYTRWGKTSCPNTASLVYSGRIGRTYAIYIKGGGGNY